LNNRHASAKAFELGLWRDGRRRHYGGSHRTGYSLIAALRYVVRRAKLARELLMFVVPTLRDDAFRAHLFG